MENVKQLKWVINGNGQHIAKLENTKDMLFYIDFDNDEIILNINYDLSRYSYKYIRGFEVVESVEKGKELAQEILNDYVLYLTNMLNQYLET